MTTGLIVYNVMGIQNSPKPDNLRNILINDIFEQTDSTGNAYILPKNQVITKLDVLGEPGLKMEINNLPVYIGRNGIYSITDAYITSFRIVPTKRFEQDIEATKQAQKDALTAFADVEIKAYTSENGYVKGFDIGALGELTKWIQGVEEKIVIFNKGYGHYLQGKNGVYNRKTDENGNYIDEEIYNLIIDYTYEERK